MRRLSARHRISCCGLGEVNRNTPSEDDAPTTASIREAVNRLDGRRHTEVTLGTDELFAYVAVSGGPDLFLVTGETADDEIQMVARILG